MSLSADPPACTVPAGGGVATHNLVNSGAAKIAFKVKASNNNEYRIKPVFGFVEPGAAVFEDDHEVRISYFSSMQKMTSMQKMSFTKNRE